MIYQFDTFIGYEPFEVLGTFPNEYAQFKELKYRASFTSYEFTFEQDLLNYKTSSIKVLDNDNLISNGDIFFGYLISDYFTKKIAGTIVEVKPTKDSNIVELVVLTSFDVLKDNIYYTGGYNSINMLGWPHSTDKNGDGTNDLYFDYNEVPTLLQNILVKSNIDADVVTPQDTIQAHKLITQLYRRFNIIEDVEITPVTRANPAFAPNEQAVDVILYTYDLASNQEPISIFLNDGIYNDLKVKFSEQSTNCLRMDAGESFTEFPAIAYQLEDNSVSTVILDFGDFGLTLADAQVKVPIVTERIFLEDEEPPRDIDPREYAQSYFGGKQYTNEISFRLPFNVLSGKDFEAWKFDSEFLGRKLEVYLQNMNKVESFISAYKLTNNNTIDIKLGLGRTRLTDKLKESRGG